MDSVHRNIGFHDDEANANLVKMGMRCILIK